MADRKFSYSELEEAVDLLQSRLNELEKDYMLTPHKPLSSAPTSLGEGKSAYSWDGSTLRLHRQIGGGLKTLTFS